MLEIGGRDLVCREALVHVEVVLGALEAGAEGLLEPRDREADGEGALRVAALEAGRVVPVDVGARSLDHAGVDALGGLVLGHAHEIVDVEEHVVEWAVFLVDVVEVEVLRGGMID